MSKPQPFIGVQFAREWRIRRPYVYRYLEREYVDRFFNDGVLRLSSFAAFGKHPDEERNDPSEGWGVLNHHNTEGHGQEVYAAVSQGLDAYVLCGSALPSEVLKENFGTDSGFRINDPTGFANFVSHHIPGFRLGSEGPCIYVQSRLVERNMGPIDFESMKIPGASGAMDMNKLSVLLSQIAGDDLYYMKPSKYAHQHEYRLLWLVTAQVTDFIEIKCPEAVQFCTRFEDLLAGKEPA